MSPLVGLINKANAEVHSPGFWFTQPPTIYDRQGEGKDRFIYHVAVSPTFYNWEKSTENTAAADEKAPLNADAKGVVAKPGEEAPVSAVERINWQPNLVYPACSSMDGKTAHELQTQSAQQIAQERVQRIKSTSTEEALAAGKLGVPPDGAAVDAPGYFKRMDDVDGAHDDKAKLIQAKDQVCDYSE